jgi:hypothetical protein
MKLRRRGVNYPVFLIASFMLPVDLVRVAFGYLLTGLFKLKRHGELDTLGVLKANRHRLSRILNHHRRGGFLVVPIHPV